MVSFVEAQPGVEPAGASFLPLRRVAVAVPPPKPSVQSLLPRLRGAAGLLYVVSLVTTVKAHTRPGCLNYFAAGRPRRIPFSRSVLCCLYLPDLRPAFLRLKKSLSCLNKSKNRFCPFVGLALRPCVVEACGVEPHSCQTLLCSHHPCALHPGSPPYGGCYSAVMYSAISALVAKQNRSSYDVQ